MHRGGAGYALEILDGTGIGMARRTMEQGSGNACRFPGITTLLRSSEELEYHCHSAFRPGGIRHCECDRVVTPTR